MCVCVYDVCVCVHLDVLVYECLPLKCVVALSWQITYIVGFNIAFGFLSQVAK